MKKCTMAFARATFAIVAALSFCRTSGQLTMTTQLRTRTEYRNGAGTLIPKSNDASFFTSQRTRLTFNYRSNRVIFQASVQDVRVWGQDASTISSADGNKLGVHEAWAEVILSNKKDSSFRKSFFEYLAFKVGRQELLYDDSRLLGNLDWLQQARRHDALVIKMKDKGWQIDAGFAFNQNTDAFNYNGTYYTPANVPPTIRDSKGFLVATPAGLVPLTGNTGLSSKGGSPAFINAPSTNGMNQHYKSLEFLYIARNVGNSRLSGLLVADHFGKYVIDSVQTSNLNEPGFVYGRRFNQKGVNGRFTSGILWNIPLNKSKTIVATAGIYYQSGKDKDGLKLDAYTTTLAINFSRRHFVYTAGWDYVSGNSAFSSPVANHRFDPLYGTPHKFWGYMDYFYAGTGSPAGGLNNPFLKIKYSSATNRITASADLHYFALANDMKADNGTPLNRYLGTEFDLLATYALNKMVSIESGFSLMKASPSMEYAKNIPRGTTQRTGTWCYVMINIRPEFLIK